jgi:hypothetical protein
MFNRSSGPTLVNVTFWGNTASYRGGGMYNDFSSTPTLVNTILWGNDAVDSGDEIFNADTSTPLVSYSLVAGCGGSGAGWQTQLGTDGGNNRDAPPLFVDGAAGNLRLAAGSPAIDAGNNTAIPASVSMDLDAQPRIQDGTVDMGAYEGTLGPRLFVDRDASGANDGSSWTHAFTDLQSAVAAAVAGDEIWVAAGTYKPTAGSERGVSFQLASGVGVYGGFAANETLRSQRDWAANVTTLSGDIGTEGDNSDNSYHVVSTENTDSTTVLDGFTVTGGRADGLWGGGMWLLQSSARVVHVVFSANSAHAGGGLGEFASSPTLVNVAFTGNMSTADGGGMSNNDFSSPTLVDVVFSGNISLVGGAMFNYSSSPTLVNVSASGNTASSRGGGIDNDGNSTPTLTNTILWGNSAVGQSSEISNTANSTPLISYSLIAGCGGSGAGWQTWQGTDGGHNLDGPPLFADGASGNLRLTADSPAIDAGDNGALPAGLMTDLDGQPRIVGATVDLGAYEFDVVVSAGAAPPTPFALHQNAPNPFNPSTRIRYDVGEAGHARLTIFDLRGRLITALVDGPVEPGVHWARWDGRDARGRRVAAGVYFYRLVAPGRSAARRMVLVP